jgi:phosphoglycolate phosphatase
MGFRAAGTDLSDDRLNALFDRFIAHYRAHIADESRPFPGCVEALDAMLAAGAILAVCTNKRTDLSVQLLETLRIANRFSAIVGPDQGAQKPDPRHLLRTIEQAGGDPRRAVMVGDAKTDADAARGAKVPLVLVSFGYTETPASELDPDILIDSFVPLPGACSRLLSGPLPVGS